MKVLYMAHPVGAATPVDVAANLARAKRWLRYLQDRYADCAIIAPWITMCEIYDDANPAHRTACLERDCEAALRCDGIILCGGRAPGWRSTAAR